MAGVKGKSGGKRANSSRRASLKQAKTIAPSPEAMTALVAVTMHYRSITGDQFLSLRQMADILFLDAFAKIDRKFLKDTEVAHGETQVNP